METGQSNKMQIYNVLKDRIVYLIYPPGYVLNEKKLCQEFKISRTPLREALLKLQDQKLIRMIPRSGTFVAGIDLLEIKDLFVVKQTLEGLAAELAAERISQHVIEVLEKIFKQVILAGKNNDNTALTQLDQQFHKTIHNLTFNKPLEEMLESINARCARGWYYYSRTLGELLTSVENLEDVYQALQKKDKVQARMAMEKHVSTFLDKIKKIMG